MTQFEHYRKTEITYVVDPFGNSYVYRSHMSYDARCMYCCSFVVLLFFVVVVVFLYVHCKQLKSWRDCQLI